MTYPEYIQWKEENPIEWDRALSDCTKVWNDYATVHPLSEGVYVVDSKFVSLAKIINAILDPEGHKRLINDLVWMYVDWWENEGNKEKLGELGVELE